MSVINYTIPHEFTSLSNHQWRAFQGQAGREWAEEMASEEERNRVYAMPLGAALDELFGPGDGEIRMLINDQIQENLEAKWGSDKKALAEDRAAAMAEDRGY